MLIFIVGILGIGVAAMPNEDPEGEEKNWTYTGFFSQQLNQVAFSNWAAGGENSFSSTSVVNFGADYTKDLISWENKLELAYGIVKTDDISLRKNQDRIDLLSKLGRNISPRLGISALGNFKSQFGNGYHYPNDSVAVSRFMAPGYLITALGLDYKPWEFFSVFFSPATGKFTFVRDQTLADEGAYGVEPGETLRTEFGAMLRLAFEKEVVENVRLASTLELFNNLTDQNKSNRKNTDVNWQTNIHMKVNPYITATFMLHMIYDHDIPIPLFETVGDELIQVGTGPRLQLQQMLGVGLSYTF